MVAFQVICFGVSEKLQCEQPTAPLPRHESFDNLSPGKADTHTLRAGS